MLIVAGPASKDLAQEVSDIVGLQTAELESKIFPDGDSYFRLRGEISGKDAAVIQSTYPPQDRNLMQLFLLIDGLRGLDCRMVYAVVPYLAYMRQDKRFLEGEFVSAQSILNIIKRLKSDKLVTIDIHNRDVLSPLGSFSVDLTAMPLLASWIKSHGWKSSLIVAPDKGASQRAKAVSEAVRTDYAVGTKTRDRQTGKVMVEFDAGLMVEGRVAVIVDDTIARGDTVINAAEILLDRGAKSVAALCTHGLFLENAIERIEDAGVKEIVSTNTIPTSKSKISVAPILADFLRPLASQKAHG